MNSSTFKNMRVCQRNFLATFARQSAKALYLTQLHTYNLTKNNITNSAIISRLYSMHPCYNSCKPYGSYKSSLVSSYVHFLDITSALPRSSVLFRCILFHFLCTFHLAISVRHHYIHFIICRNLQYF